MMGLIDEVLNNSIGSIPGQVGELKIILCVICVEITDKDADVCAIL